MSRLWILLVLFLLLAPLMHGRASLHEGELLVMTQERWRLCGSVALNPKHPKWSCCRGVYPFHRPTQRCCQTHEKFFVIPRNPNKSEVEDCRTYNLETIGYSEN